MRGLVSFVFLSLFGSSLCGDHKQTSFFSDETGEVDSSEFGMSAGNFTTTCNCGRANKQGLRVVNGRDAECNEFPWIVAVVNVETNHNFCGGTIVTPRHVITAGHCTDDYLDPNSDKYNKQLQVVAGDNNIKDKKDTKYTQKINVAKIYQHEDYDLSQIINDISILVLQKELVFTKAVGPACMLSAPVDLDNQMVYLTGWGLTQDQKLNGKAAENVQTTNLRIVPYEKCQKSYQKLMPGKKQVCTFSDANRGACQGDSGGPLTWVDPSTNRYVLIGVVSFGRFCAGDDPTVYTSPIAYLPWIKAKIADSYPYEMCYKKA